MFDLDVARKTALESDGSNGFDFDLNGEHFRFPGIGFVSLEAQEALAEGDVTKATRLVLGDDDYARLKAAGASLLDIKLLFEELSRISGADDLGNSGASAPRGSTQT